jgi:hypothetical protein
MRKLAALVVLGAGCAIGFPCLVTAADVVQIQCNVGGIIFADASAGVEVPPSCRPKSFNCAQCEADLLSESFTVGSPPLSLGDGAIRYDFTRLR